MLDQSEVRHATIPPEADGGRLDKVAAGIWPDLSRSRLRALIEAGHLSGDRPLTPSSTVRAGEIIRLEVPPPVDAAPKPQNIPLSILYEDAAVLVIDKPAGLVVHPAPGHADGTLVNAVMAHCGQSLTGVGGERRPVIVHRLDKDTSGVMVVAKTQNAHQHLVDQFSAHSIDRRYTAFVAGVPNPLHGLIDLAIGRSPTDRKRMAVVSRGRSARTHYETVQRFAGVAAQICCTLETGRTHQIRVHLSHMGHPVLGDPVYMTSGRGRRRDLKPVSGDMAALGRQALHAALLGFDHPTSGVRMRFESDLPPDLQNLHSSLTKAFG